MDYEEFKSDCLEEICNRITFINKHCYKDSKIRRCYIKYEKQQEKNELKRQQQAVKLQEKVREKSKKIKNDYIDRMDKYLSGEIEDFYGYTENIDEKWVKLRQQVIERDKDCVVWNHILTPDQKIFVLDNFWRDYKMLDFMDVAHIESIARKPELKYDINNVVTMKRFFHDRLDQYRDFVTGEKITAEERDFYLDMLKGYIREKQNN